MMSHIVVFITGVVLGAAAVFYFLHHDTQKTVEAAEALAAKANEVLKK